MRSPSNYERKLNYALAQRAELERLIRENESEGKHPFASVHLRAGVHRLNREIGATRQRIEDFKKPKR